jgi:hypothetical protein
LGWRSLVSSFGRLNSFSKGLEDEHAEPTIA